MALPDQLVSMPHVEPVDGYRSRELKDLPPLVLLSAPAPTGLEGGMDEVA